MRDHRITSLLTTDGEILPVYEERQPSNSYTMGAWMITWDDKRRHIARTIKSGPTLRVLYALPDYLDFENFKRLDQVRLSGELDLAQSSVSRALAELLERDIIEKEGRGAHIAWRMSLNYGWRGNVAGFHTAKRKRDGEKVRPFAPTEAADSRRRYIMEIKDVRKAPCQAISSTWPS